MIHTRNAYRVLTGKLGIKLTLRSPWHTGQENIQFDIREIAGERVGCIRLVQPGQCGVVKGHQISTFCKMRGEFLGFLRGY